MFSIIIPYYKKRKYIERCLDSVLAQTFTDYEIILVDDGSEDTIAELISEKYLDKVKLIQQKNQGVSVARNIGIKNAIHDYIAFLDADDFWSPFYLEKNAAVINKNKEIGIIGSHYSSKIDDVETENLPLNFSLLYDYFKTAIINTVFFTSATIVKREFFEKNEGFNPTLKNGEDIDVWFRVILAEGSAFYINNTLVFYSDEDMNQATKKHVDVNSSFLFLIPDLYAKYYKNATHDFDVYLSKLMYLGFRHHFFSKQKNELVKEIMLYRKKSFFFGEIYYMIPFIIGEKLNESAFFRRWIRKYFKFLFRYIYTQ